MKNKLKAAAGIAVLALATALFFGLPGTDITPAAKADDSSYWNRFKSIFVDWDDDAEPGQARTEVTGVRGLNVEEALGTKDYDWKAVKYMEDLKISMEQEKKFLKEGGLGPYAKR